MHLAPLEPRSRRAPLAFSQSLVESPTRPISVQAKPKFSKCGLSRLNPHLEKQPKWGFWGNFGPFENVELSRLNPKLAEKDWVQPAQLEF